MAEKWNLIDHTSVTEYIENKETISNRMEALAQILWLNV